jgi:glycyl-tRNA synthetase beta chain
VTVAVSLADKLDNLVGFFLIDERPTGSRDPFALRRAALGVIEILTAQTLRLSLVDAIAQATGSFTRQMLSPDGNEERLARHKAGIGLAFEALPGFFADRLKVQQRDAGVRHDLIDAVFALGEDDLVRLLARVRALQDFVETEDGADLLTAYKRAANILKREKWEGGKVAGNPEIQPEEQALIDALDEADPEADAAVKKEDFTAAMSALASLRRPIDDFFDHVTVNDPDKDRRARRLNLLMRFRDAVNRVADFSRIEG